MEVSVTYGIENQHLREQMDCSMRHSGREGVELVQSWWLWAREEVLDGHGRGDVADVHQCGGTQEICDHLQLVRGRGR